MKKILLLTILAFVAAGCNENQKVSQLRLEKNKLAQELKAQTVECAESIELLNDEHKQATESLKSEYEAKIAEMDELLAHLQQQAEIDKISLDSYAKMLIKMMPEQERLAAENAELKAEIEKLQSPPLSAEETKAKLDQVARLRQKAIDDAN